MTAWTYICCIILHYLLLHTGNKIVGITTTAATSIPEHIPHSINGSTKVTLYPPDPPATHHILMGIKYFDELLQKDQIAEIIIEVYSTVVPKTVNTFIKLCNGVRITLPQYVTEDKPEYATYKKSKLTKVIKGDMIGGGSVVTEGSYTVYGPTMRDENFFLKHDRPGRLSMMNLGVPDSNDSRFFFSMNPLKASKYDGKNVVFGQVVRGLDTLERLQENVAVDEDGTPVRDVEIEYIIVDTVTSEYFDKLHEEYLERLERFESGDISVGIELQPSTASMQEEIFQLANLKLADMGHPLRRVVIGLTMLCLMYIFAKFGRRILNLLRGQSHSHNVVSMRDV